MGVGALHRTPGWFETSPYEALLAGRGIARFWGWVLRRPGPWVPAFAGTTRGVGPRTGSGMTVVVVAEVVCWCVQVGT